MNLDDIAAIRAVRTAHAMTMPAAIHPMKEHGQSNQKEQSKKPEAAQEAEETHSEGDWMTAGGA